MSLESYYQSQQETLRDDFLHLSFIMKTLLFSEAYLERSRISMMELLLRK